MGLINSAVYILRQYWPILLGLLLAIVAARRRWKPHIRNIPGPFLASMTDLWLFQHYLRRQGISEWRLHREYNSSLLRLGPNTVSVADVQASRIIYGWKPVFPKSRLYISQHQTGVSGDTITNVSAEMNEEKHGQIRRPIASAYAMTSVLQYEPSVNALTTSFISKCDRFARTNAECDLSRWLQMYAFDVIGQVTFGKPFGFVESESDVEDMMHHTGRAMDWIGMVGQIPTADELVRLKLYGKLRSYFGGSNSVVGFSERRVREYAPPEDGTVPDFLTKFFRAREKYPEIFTDAQMVEFANTNVGGGSDTTAIALREVVYRLITNPGSKERFLDEVKTTIDNRRDDETRDDPITYKEGLGMEFFQASLKECLRIHPPLGQLLPRIVPKGGTELSGQYLPEGTIVGSNCWTVSRDKTFYGADADEYRPERWLDPDREKVDRMENASLVFGGGPRVCIGRNIALMEVNKLIPELFRRFEVTLADKTRYRLKPGWLVLQYGLDVRLKRRECL